MERLSRQRLKRKSDVKLQEVKGSKHTFTCGHAHMHLDVLQCVTVADGKRWTVRHIFSLSVISNVIVTHDFNMSFMK
ncbi:hypothetical protein JOB18_003153 [Solea senegalensis]|uniref:Uncharacterized protein n=1 Tax=Solea senegalensis TaxID=28829 RepID=A0AAV6Q3Z9_SOLSE|nr:hypothetical protein JOB18_003153 [Solea senegalensis]